MSKSENERSDTSPELGPVSACWSCQGPVAARAIFCHACGSVQPPGDTDHFTRLGMPRTFDLDLDKLEKQYLGFQRVLHPDRFVAKPAKQRMIAESQAVAMNEAFETLQDPLRRAAYLLKLHGRAASVSQDQTVNDPELLMEAMEARETLAEAESIDVIEELQVAAGAKAIDLIAQLSRAFAEEDYERADKLTTRFKYLRKYLEETRTRRSALEDFA
ncbi:MAG TPA: Fe-S protein assembly co-chaperone HscB [Dongiaceae bacterium]|jgi:molecular chaperone HscB